MVPLETGHAIADATDSDDVLAVEEDGVIVTLLVEEELEVNTDGAIEDALKVDSGEDATVAEVEAWEANEVLEAVEEGMFDEEGSVLEVDVRELARALPTLLKERVSTVAACAAEFTAVLGAEARTVVLVEDTAGTTDEAIEVVLKIELGEELLGQLCMRCVTVWRVPVTVEVSRLVIVVVL